MQKSFSLFMLFRITNLLMISFSRSSLLACSLLDNLPKAVVSYFYTKPKMAPFVLLTNTRSYSKDLIPEKSNLTVIVDSSLIILDTFRVLSNSLWK